MGGFILILFLVVAVCGGIPLVLFAYAQGRLAIPKRLLTVFIFGGILIAAIIEFPIRFSSENPIGFGVLLIVYAFIAGLLSYEYTRSKWLFCLFFVFLSNCLGVLIKCFIIVCFMVKNSIDFTFIDIVKYLIITQIIATLAHFTAPKKKLGNYQAKKRKR